MSQRLFSCVLAALFALAWSISWCSPPACADQPRPPVYRIEVRLTETPTSGKERVLSRPVVMTPDRQEAMIQVGRRDNVVIEDDEVAHIDTGITCRFTPYRLKDDGVKLDLEIEIVEQSRDMDDAIVARTFGVRRIQQVPLGRRVRVPLSRRGGKPTHHLELTVSEVPQPEAADDVPPPPGTGASDDDIFSFFRSFGR